MNITAKDQHVYHEMTVEQAEILIRDLHSAMTMARLGQTATNIMFGEGSFKAAIFMVQAQ